MPYSRTVQIAVILLVLTPLLATAHGVNFRLETDPDHAVIFSYENGAPLAAARFEIIPPDSPEPFLTGRADDQGRVLFQPDRPGQWLVKTFTEDGHGSVAEVTVNSDLSWAGESGGKPNKLLSNLYGLAALLGVFAIAWLMSRLKSGSEQG